MQSLECPRKPHGTLQPSHGDFRRTDQIARLGEQGVWLSLLARSYPDRWWSGRADTSRNSSTTRWTNIAPSGWRSFSRRAVPPVLPNKSKKNAVQPRPFRRKRKCSNAFQPGRRFPCRGNRTGRGPALFPRTARRLALLELLGPGRNRSSSQWLASGFRNLALAVRKEGEHILPSAPAPSAIQQLANVV